MELNRINLKYIIAKPFHPVHVAIKNNTHTHFKLKGGRGSTKSSFAGIEIPLGIMADPQANAVILRKIENTLRESVFAQIQWGVEKLGVSQYWKFYTSPMKAVYLPTGQRIAFKGADEPMKLKSTKFPKGYCKFIWYEEVTEFTPEDIRNINQSLMRGGDKFICLYTYNPPASVQSWVNIDAQTPRSDTLVHHSTYLDVPREWLGDIFFTEAEHLKAVNEEAYNHEYLGEVTGTGGEVFRNVIGEAITDEQIKNFDRIYRGMDFGYAVDPLHYAEVYYDKTRRRLYIYDEIHGVGMNNRTAVNEIKKRVTGNQQIIADSAEPRTINEFRELGLYGILPAKKGADSVEHGVKWLQDLEQIIIDPARCPNTYKEFCGYELERDKDNNFKAQYPDKNNHSIDAVRYAMNDEILQRNIKFY